MNKERVKRLYGEPVLPRNQESDSNSNDGCKSGTCTTPEKREIDFRTLGWRFLRFAARRTLKLLLALVVIILFLCVFSFAQDSGLFS